MAVCWGSGSLWDYSACRFCFMSLLNLISVSGAEMTEYCLPQLQHRKDVDGAIPSFNKLLWGVHRHLNQVLLGSIFAVISRQFRKVALMCTMKDRHTERLVKKQGKEKNKYKNVTLHWSIDVEADQWRLDILWWWAPSSHPCSLWETTIFQALQHSQRA